MFWKPHSLLWNQQALLWSQQPPLWSTQALLWTCKCRSAAHKHCFGAPQPLLWSPQAQLWCSQTLLVDRPCSEACRRWSGTHRRCFGADSRCLGTHSCFCFEAHRRRAGSHRGWSRQALFDSGFHSLRADARRPTARGLPVGGRRLPTGKRPSSSKLAILLRKGIVFPTHPSHFLDSVFNCIAV